MTLLTNSASSSELEKELVPNETLLWSGKPKPGLVVRPLDFMPFIVGLGWAVIPIVFIYQALTSNLPAFVILFSLPFCAIGWYASFGRFWHDKRNRERTEYGITSQRILIRSGAFRPALDTYNIATLTNLRVEEKKDGSGNIRLAAQAWPFTMMSSLITAPWKSSQPDIERIVQVREVYDLLIQLQYAPKANG